MICDELFKDDMLVILKKKASEYLKSVNYQMKDVDAFLEKKMEEAFNLIRELCMKDYTIFTQENRETIKANIEFIKSTLKTFEYIRNLASAYIEVIENADSESEYEKSVTEEFVFILLVLYGYLCEVIRAILVKLIVFPDGRVPNGIGRAIKKLKEEMHIENTAFLDDIDTPLRNAVFHMDFEIDGENITYRKNGSNFNLKLSDLYDKIKKLDLMGYTLINIIAFIEIIKYG